MKETEFLEIDAVADILRSVTFMSLTSCTDNKPWCSPVFYAFDHNFNFYWKSSPSSRHSVNIKTNPNTSVTIYNSILPDGEGWGIYFEGVSEEILNRAEIEEANRLSYARLNQELHPIDWLLENDCPRKFYKFLTNKISINGIEKVNGVWVDIRKEISLSDLQRSYYRG